MENKHEGQDLKTKIKESGLTIEHVSSQSGISKMTLFRMFKQESIPKYKLNHILKQIDPYLIKKEHENLLKKIKKLELENSKLTEKIKLLTGTKTGQL